MGVLLHLIHPWRQAGRGLANNEFLIDTRIRISTIHIHASTPPPIISAR